MTNYSQALNMFLKIVDFSEIYLITSSGETHSKTSLSQPINMNASSLSFPVDRKRVFTCLSLLKALSQLTWVNESVKRYS